MSTCSLRAILIRTLVRRVVGPKFKRAGGSVAKLRELNEFAIKNQKVPRNTSIRPVQVGGIDAEWVSAPDTDTGGVILFLHGGAFIMGSPATHRELAARLSAAAGLRVLVIDYRLAPESPFPHAIHDAVTAYRWLLDNGYSDKRITIGGDSAGGGLTLQTLISIRDEGLTQPAAAFLMSPQTDWIRFDGESYVTRTDLDPLNTLEMCRFSAAQYIGNSDPEPRLLSPVYSDLSGLPPLCIHVGDHEILLSDSTRLAERARASNVDVELTVWPGMWHVFQNCAGIVPEARRSIKEIGRFLRAHTKR